MCNLCKTKPVYEFTNQRKLCKTCFVRWFQKKVLYTIRKFGMVRKDDIIGYYKDKSFRGVVLQDVLKMFSEKAPVKLVKLAPEKTKLNIFRREQQEKSDYSKFSSKKKLDKIAIASTTDLEADKIVHALIRGGNKLNSPKQDKNIFPLYLFLDKEVLLYAKLRNLKFKKVKEDKDKISEFIDELEKTHPEVKQAVVGGYSRSC